MTMACLHMLFSQGHQVLQTSELTVLCSSLRLIPVDSAAVSLLTYINKTNKCSNFERQRQVICACYYFAGQAITEICARIGWHALTHPHKQHTVQDSTTQLECYKQQAKQLARVLRVHC